MKSLNHFIWNDEELDVNPQELSASSLDISADFCTTLPTVMCNVINYTTCTTPTLTDSVKYFV